MDGCRHKKRVVFVFRVFYGGEFSTVYGLVLYMDWCCLWIDVYGGELSLNWCCIRIKKQTLLSYPLKGTGVPHFKSLVIHLGWSPPFNQDLAITLALLLHFSDDLSNHSSRSCSSWGRSRNRWLLVLIFGHFEQSLQRGDFNSTALMSLPQASHWSPRASENLGQKIIQEKEGDIEE